jgi:hypothetical protein
MTPFIIHLPEGQTLWAKITPSDGPIATMDGKRTKVEIDLIKLREAVRENPTLLAKLWDFIAAGLAPAEDSGSPPEQRQGPYPGGHACPPYGTGADDKHARPAGFLHHPVAPPRDE